jgi:hypothetical protein
MRHFVLDLLDDLSNLRPMAKQTLTWPLIDAVAAELGATPAARAKWRARRVPFKWQVKIMDALEPRGVRFPSSDFEALGSNSTQTEQAAA